MNNLVYLGSGILLFALATIILYIMGLKRKMTEEQRLMDMLLNNSARRVVDYLKDHDSVTMDGIGYICKDVKAKEFMASKTAIIQDGSLFQKRIVEFMLGRDLIEKCGTDKGKALYCLKKKEEKK